MVWFYLGGKSLIFMVYFAFVLIAWVHTSDPKTLWWLMIQRISIDFGMSFIIKEERFVWIDSLNSILLAYFWFLFWVWCSLGVFKWFIDPSLQWILPDQCSPLTSQEFCSYGGFYAFLRGGLLQLFYVSMLLT